MSEKKEERKRARERERERRVKVGRAIEKARIYLRIA